MATFYLPSSGGYSAGTYVRYRIKIVEGTLSGRTRPVTVSVEYWRTNTGYTTYGSGTCYCTIAGTTYSQAFGPTKTVTYNSYTELFSKTVNITYDNYGNASLAVSAYSSANVANLNSSSNGGKATLTKISALTYAVTYNANGGSGAPASQTKSYGTTLTLSSTKPTRSGYNFLGWATSSTATAATYKSGASYTSNAALTLYAVWQVAYIKPRITNLKIYRSTSSGVASDSGTYFTVEFDWATDKTVSSITVKWKKTSATSWSSSTITASGTSGTVTAKTFGSGNISVDSSYNVSVTVADASGSSPAAGTVAGQAFPIDILNGGNGIAFGKPAETANLLDSNWDIHLKGYKVLSMYSGYALTGGIALSDGDDLNSDTFKVPGNYYCSSSATAKTLLNCPTTAAFTMKVLNATGVNYKAQLIMVYNTGNMIYRYYNHSATTPAWTAWHSITGSTTIDINDYLGDYVVSRGSVAMTTSMSGVTPTGTWYYEKWNSGKAVCWGKNNFGTIACSTAWGYMYTSSALSINLPSGLFNGNPQYTSAELLYAGGNDLWINRGSIAPTSSAIAGICLTSGTSKASLSNTTISFHVIGTWK